MTVYDVEVTLKFSITTTEGDLNVAAVQRVQDDGHTVGVQRGIGATDEGCVGYLVASHVKAGLGELGDGITLIDDGTNPKSWHCEILSATHPTI